MILVVGATGNLGGAIAHTLLAQGKEVRILARPGSNYQPLVEAGAIPVSGDMKDPSSLGPVCEGVDTLITTANSVLRGGEDNIQTVDIEGNRNLIDAAKAAGVTHFIYISASIADLNSPVQLNRAKGLTEEYLKASGLTYTIIAPDAFMEVWLGMVVGMAVGSNRPVTLVEPGTHRHTFISIGDVVGYTVAAVDNPAAKNQRLVLGGPQALSWKDIVGIYERVLGHPVPVQYVAPGEPIPQLPGEMPQILAGLEMFESTTDITELSKTYGVKPTGVEEFVKGSLVGR